MPRPTVTKQFGNPWALVVPLALGALQPQALGFLNGLVTLAWSQHLTYHTTR